jgi:hypothetical protein
MDCRLAGHLRNFHDKSILQGASGANTLIERQPDEATAKVVLPGATMADQKSSGESIDAVTRAKLLLEAGAPPALLLALASGYKLPSPPTGREMAASLTRRVKLPSPLQLANLAATCGPTDKPDEAIRNALRLYLRAEVFHRSHANDGLPALALAAGENDLFVVADATEKVGPKLTLAMDQPDDAVRRYLRKKGTMLKKARSAKANILAWLKITDMQVLLLTKNLPWPVEGSMTEKEREKKIQEMARNAGPLDFQKGLPLDQCVLKKLTSMTAYWLPPGGPPETFGAVLQRLCKIETAI